MTYKVYLLLTDLAGWTIPSIRLCRYVNGGSWGSMCRSPVSAGGLASFDGSDAIFIVIRTKMCVPVLTDEGNRCRPRPVHFACLLHPADLHGVRRGDAA